MSESNVIEMGGPADTKNGYLLFGAVFTNNADHEYEPEKSSVEVSAVAVDAANEPTGQDLGNTVARFVGKGRTFWNPDDNIPPGTRIKIVLSAAEGPKDDGTIYWTVGPDRIGLTNVSGMTAQELDAPFDENA